MSGEFTDLEIVFAQLSPDGRQAGAQFSEVTRTDIGARALRKILRNLEQLAPQVEFPVQPALRITTPAGKFIIQAKAGRLTFVSWASGQHTTVTPTIDDMVRIVTGEIVEGEPDDIAAPVVVAGPATGSRRKRVLIVALLIVVVVAVNVFTLFEARKPPGNFLPSYRLLEPASGSRLLENVAGEYETGAQPGDRRLEITRAGEVRWIKFGVARAVAESRDLTVQAVQANGLPGLLTNRNTLITVKGPITLTYFNDTYTRVTK